MSAALAGDLLHAVLEFAEGAVDDLGLKLLDSLRDGHFQLVQRLRLFLIQSRLQVAQEEKVAGCVVGERGGHSVGPLRPIQRAGTHRASRSPPARSAAELFLA